MADAGASSIVSFKEDVASQTPRAVVDLQSTLLKHKEAIITVFEVRKYDCCADEKRGGKSRQPF